MFWYLTWKFQTLAFNAKLNIILLKFTYLNYGIYFICFRDKVMFCMLFKIYFLIYTEYNSLFLLGSSKSFDKWKGKIITTIRIQNKTLTPKLPCAVPCRQNFLPPFMLTTTVLQFSVPMAFFSEMSCKWNHTVCNILNAALFTLAQ